MRTRFNSISNTSPRTVSLSIPAQGPAHNKRISSFEKTTRRIPRVSHLLKGTDSDRMAIFDHNSGSYCAYSLAESVNQSGLTLHEAEEWVQGLRIINQSPGLNQIMHIGFMILASWGITALGIWSLIQLFV